MFERLIGIALVCSCVQPTFAQEVKLYETQGSAPIARDDRVHARADAIQSAWIDIAVQYSSELVPKDIFFPNKDIVTRVFAEAPKQWISDFKVLNESSSNGKSVQVLVSANPNRKRIREELIRTGILFDRAKRPIFGSIKLQGGVQANVWAAKITSRLKLLGYTVLDQGGDYAVDGAFTSLQGKTLAFEFQVISPGNKAQASKIMVNVTGNDPSEVVAGGLAIKILTQVLPAWFRQTGSGRVYEVSISSLKSYAPYKELRDLFNSGSSGFTSGVETSYAQGLVSFDVIFDGDVRMLSRALDGMKLKSNTLKVVEVRETTLRLEAK